VADWPVVNSDKASAPSAAQVARQHQQSDFPYSGNFGNGGYGVFPVRNRIGTDVTTVTAVFGHRY
jgi:hypothetical protein